MKTLRFADAPGVLVIVHTRETPNQAEWDIHMAHVVNSLHRLHTTAILVITEGGAPNASMRAQLARACGDAATFTALCNESVIVQHVITAIGWITRGRARGFSYDDVAGAMAYLGLDSSRRGEIIALIRRLQRELGARLVKV